MVQDPTADPVYERWYNGDHSTADFVETADVSVMQFARNMLESLGFEPAQATERRDHEGRRPGRGPEGVEFPDKYELNPLPSALDDEDDREYAADGHRVAVSVSGTEHRVDEIYVQEFDHENGAKMEWSLSSVDDFMQYVLDRDRMAPQFGDVVEGDAVDIDPYDVRDETELWEYGTEQRL